jgi:hypothetical protein
MQATPLSLAVEEAAATELLTPTEAQVVKVDNLVAILTVEEMAAQAQMADQMMAMTVILDQAEAPVVIQVMVATE